MKALGWLSVALMASGAAVAQTPLEAEAQDITEAFMLSLKSSLTASLQEGGPVEAIQHCQHLAPSLAEQFTRKGWQVGRTSLKLRNPKNAPDEWELAQLLSFAQRLEQGDKPAELFASQEQGGEFRYMQAIVVGKPCLACHGESLTPEITQILDARYPQDKARGYTAGQLRGAFTLRKTLNEP